MCHVLRYDCGHTPPRTRYAARYRTATDASRKRYTLEGGDLLQTIAPVNGLPRSQCRGHERPFAPSWRVSITAAVCRMRHLPADEAILVRRG